MILNLHVHISAKFLVLPFANQQRYIRQEQPIHYRPVNDLYVSLTSHFRLEHYALKLALNKINNSKNHRNKQLHCIHVIIRPSKVIAKNQIETLKSHFLLDFSQCTKAASASSPFPSWFRLENQQHIILTCTLILLSSFQAFCNKG